MTKPKTSDFGVYYSGEGDSVRTGEIFSEDVGPSWYGVRQKETGAGWYWEGLTWNQMETGRRSHRGVPCVSQEGLTRASSGRTRPFG